MLGQVSTREVISQEEQQQQVHVGQPAEGISSLYYFLTSPIGEQEKCSERSFCGSILDLSELGFDQL